MKSSPKKITYQRKYHAAHRERENARRRARYFANLDAEKAKMAEWRRAHTEQIREAHLRYKYSITQADYDRMLKAQKGRCAICRSEKVGRRGSRFFVVDHCHESKRKRGLLCHWCNLMIGHARNRPKVLEAAIAYLKAA